jgi:nicotinic acid mononucleotide adenylyltransferase
MVVPSAAHAFKPDLPAFIHRYNMAKLGVNDLRYNGRPSLPFHSDIRVSMLEVDMLCRQEAPIRTYELLKEIAQGYPDTTEIKFAIGPDILEEIHKWERVPEIRKEFGFVELPVHGMRATKIRGMLAEGVDSWKRHVPSSVQKYITRHGLYQKATS